MQDTRKKILIKQWRQSEKKPKLVVDTNLVFSALFSKGGASFKLLERLTRQEFHLCLSRPVFEEYKAVTARLSKLSHTKRTKFIGKLRQHSFWVRSQEKLSLVLRDPSDDKFLECALASDADFIVSRDKDLLDLKDFQIPIVSLDELNEILGWK